MAYNFHPTVLREYDIRGIIGETLGPDDARAIGRGFGTLLVRDIGDGRVPRSWRWGMMAASALPCSNMRWSKG